MPASIGSFPSRPAPGTYAGGLDALPPGQWRLVVEVTGPDGVELRRERRLTVE